MNERMNKVIAERQTIDNVTDLINMWAAKRPAPDFIWDNFPVGYTAMLNISESVMVSFWRRTEDVYVVNASHYCTRDQALQLYNWLKQDQRVTIYDFYKQQE